MTNPAGPLKEEFLENHFSTSADGTGNKNPDNKMALSSAEMKSGRKDRGLNLRKSLAWNSAFFTEEGVLDPLELSKITGFVTKQSSGFSSKPNVESSSMAQFDRFSKRTPLHNIEENLLIKPQTNSITRSSKKKPTNLPISKASSHDGLQISLATRKSSTKGITKDLPIFDVSYSKLGKGKTEVSPFEKDASILKLNYCPSTSKRTHIEMSFSTAAPIQGKHSSLRIPSQHGRVEKAKTMKLKSYPSFSTKAPTPTSRSVSAGVISSISQQAFNILGIPPPIVAKPSAMRMPSPSLRFFEQKTAASSHSNQLPRTSQVPNSDIPSLKRPDKNKQTTLCRPSVTRSEEQSQGTFPTKTNACPGKYRSTSNHLTSKGSIITRTNFEAQTKKMYSEHIDMKGTISSNVCGSSNCLPDVANEIKGKTDVPCGNTIKEKPSYEGSDIFFNSRLPCISISEKEDTHIEPRSELSEEFDIQNTEEHLHSVIPSREELANSSQDVSSEQCQLQVDFKLCELKNDTSSVQGKKVPLDILNQDVIFLKDQPSSVPYLEEWLAAMEAFGEDMLKVKTGTVHNSPPDKAIPEPGPWSPVKRKVQDVGPFDCTKRTKNPAPSEE